MPTITLPDHLKRGVDNAFSNELYRRIGKGQVDAVLTFANDHNNTQTYLLEFKAFRQPKRHEFWKRILRPSAEAIALAFSGQIDNSRIGHAVDLKPASQDQEKAADLLGMSSYSLKLYSTPLEQQTQQRVRVELTPQGKRPIYMALEADASVGEPVSMLQGDIFRSEAAFVPTGDSEESATAETTENVSG